MWLWTRQEAKTIDQLSIQSGISEEHLMETAGKLSAERIQEFASTKTRTVIVFCGPGHNGGDGFVVARYLLQAGFQVQVVEHPSDKNTELRIRKKKQFRGVVTPLEAFLRTPSRADLWVDALFGIGLHRELDPQSQELIRWVKAQPGLKFSLDTPSGLNVDTGSALGSIFKADHTLTIGAPKPGFYLNQGPEHCGKISILDIGFPAEIQRTQARSVFLMTAKLAQRWLPARRATDHKSHGGRSLILAGSSRMPGAAILAAQAAARVGSGFVYVSEKEVLRLHPEAIPWNKSSDISMIDSVLIGPGLSVSSKTRQELLQLSLTGKPVVVDADALTVAASESHFKFPSHWVATPHAGELSRMISLTASEIESNRLLAARLAQQKWGGLFLLKGFHTVVAYPSFSMIVPTGNVSLAKGGSGDVLGGMIAGFLAQKVSSERAPLLASFLHGEIADHWVKSGKDYLSLTPSDLIAEIPNAIHRLRSRAGS